MSATAQKTNGRAARVPRVVETLPQPDGAALAAAVLAVQAQAPKLITDADGQVQSRTYRYVTLTEVMEVVLPLLVEHELVWRTWPTTAEDGQPALRYRMTHVPSGEYDEDMMLLMCPRVSPQDQGSGITYARRYALTAYLNLTVDQDDDGAAATAASQSASQVGSQLGSQPQAAPAKPSGRPANAKQQGMLNKIAGDAGLPASVFADIIKEVAGEQPRPWTDEDAAGRWLSRALDRLPAAHVTAVKERLLAASNRGTPQ